MEIDHMKNIATTALILSFLVGISSAAEVLPEVPDGVQALSLAGAPLRSAAAGQGALQKLEVARADYEENPDNADNIIWYGRRTAYTGDYRGAIEIFSEGIEKHPDDARMYRHRGHRYISIREFDRAIADLELASQLIEGKENEIEPDGVPNAQNIPISSLHGNIWYHLGLAYYLVHDWDNAFRAYQSGFEAARNDDNRVSTTHWRYMILRRAGRADEALRVLQDVSINMNVIENTVYQRLVLFYRGDIKMNEITGDDSDNPTNSAAAYGVANWYFYNGDVAEADARLNRHLQQASWSAFGFIAAESDMAAR
jgi:hypothetical protein